MKNKRAVLDPLSCCISLDLAPQASQCPPGARLSGGITGGLMSSGYREAGCSGAAARLERRLGGLDYPRKRLRIVHRQICQDLAVQSDIGMVQSMG